MIVSKQQLHDCPPWRLTCFTSAPSSGLAQCQLTVLFLCCILWLNSFSDSSLSSRKHIYPTVETRIYLAVMQFFFFFKTLLLLPISHPNRYFWQQIYLHGSLSPLFDSMWMFASSWTEQHEHHTPRNYAVLHIMKAICIVSLTIHCGVLFLCVQPWPRWLSRALKVIHSTSD